LRNTNKIYTTTVATTRNGREITRERDYRLWETTTKAIETNAPQLTEVTITKCRG